MYRRNKEEVEALQAKRQQVGGDRAPAGPGRMCGRTVTSCAHPHAKTQRPATHTRHAQATRPLPPTPQNSQSAQHSPLHSPLASTPTPPLAPPKQPPPPKVEADRQQIAAVIQQLDDKKRNALESTWKKVGGEGGRPREGGGWLEGEGGGSTAGVQTVSRSFTVEPANQPANPPTDRPTDQPTDQPPTPPTVTAPRSASPLGPSSAACCRAQRRASCRRREAPSSTVRGREGCQSGRP